jgi:hypothetical protein
MRMLADQLPHLEELMQVFDDLLSISLHHLLLLLPQFLRDGM